MLLIPLAVLGLFLISHGAQRYEQMRHEREDARIAVRFVYTDHDAGAVCVSGSFNSWSEQSDCMSRSGNVWSVSLLLPPGRYQYLFIVDGHSWREDPGGVLAEDDGFGAKNSVLILE